MSYPICTDKIYRIQNEEGRTLDVRPSPDGPDFVALMVVGEENEDWFGKLNLPMCPEFARQLGKALIECSKDVELGR